MGKRCAAVHHASDTAPFSEVSGTSVGNQMDA